MGRRKKALDESAPYWELAQWLRTVRDEAGLTYRQMAERVADTGYSAVTLSRADNGDALPKLEVTEAYAAACGVTRGQARRMWEQAASQIGEADQGRAATRTYGRAHSLELVLEPAHLLLHMRRLYRSAGHPSLRELQKRARINDYGDLPRSTLGAVLAGVRMPSERLLVSYVRTCGEPEYRVYAWMKALSRVRGDVGAVQG